MKKFEVEITETLQRTVTVEAASQEEAERMVDRGWRDGDYVLTDEDYVGVDFKTTGEHELSEKKMLDVLLVKPNEHPRNVSIGAELEDLQQAVGGSIGASYPFADDPVAIVYNDDGKLMGLPLNRALRDEDGQMYDAVAGTFLVVGLGEKDFASLTPELAQKYERLFHQPEDFIRLGHRMMVVRVPDEAVCPEESKTTLPKDAGFDR